MSFSLISGLRDTAPVWQDSPLAALYAIVKDPDVYASKNGQRAFMGCHFDGKGRKQENVLGLTSVVLDYDGGVSGDWEKARCALNLAQLEYVMYTSASHTKAAPRFRVVLSLSTPAQVFQLDYYVSYVSALMGVTLDRSSHTVGRLYFFGKVQATADDYVSCYVPGAFLDWLADDAPIKAPTVLATAAASHSDAADRMLDALPNTSPNRGKWVRELGGFLHAGCSDAAIARWSCRSEQYPEDTEHCLFVLSTLHDRDVTAHAVAMLADRYQSTTAQIINDFQKIVTQHDRFTVFRASDYRKGYASASWIVEDFIPLAQVGMVYGASGSGKTFFVLDMVAAIAQGKPWRNLKTTAASVAYVASEASRGIMPRLEGYYQGHIDGSLDDGNLDNLKIIEDAPDLSNLLDVKQLISKVEASGPTSLIVIDTLSASHAGNENSSQDMSIVMKHCRLISDTLTAMVLLVHHTGKEEAKGARGSSAIFAACDVVLEITNVDNVRQVRVDKQKDGEAIKPMAFTLEKITIGIDSNGKQMSTCIVKECAVAASFTRAEEKAQKESDKLRKNLRPLQLAVVEVLERLIEMRDRDYEELGPTLTAPRGISTADIIEAVHEREVDFAESKNESVNKSTRTPHARILNTLAMNPKLFTCWEEKGVVYVDSTLC